MSSHAAIDKLYDFYRRVRPESPCPEARSPGSTQSGGPPPRRNWKATLWCIYENFSAHRIMAVAAGVTFYALLALFPGIAALISLYGLFADSRSLSPNTSTASRALFRVAAPKSSLIR
ncbi:MAG: hypothetical protein JO134_00145 [Xanthobacteraceae bacterium]|nr:hypothetical protein [Xanthobacteraceae bacterium]